ncbi:MAG: ABC transporter permease subunit [Planctomycetota bacterium]|nr:ABC transporter permease subunit [Planctomycetota bacterium]
MNEAITKEDAPKASVSVFRKRLRKFRSLKRGYYSFIILVTAYILSFFLPLLMNNKALVVSYDGELYYPIATYYKGEFFGQFNDFSTNGRTETNYRLLKARFEAEDEGNWVFMPPLVPFGPSETPQVAKEKILIDAYKAGNFDVDSKDKKPEKSAEEIAKEEEKAYSGGDEDEDDGGFKYDPNKFKDDKDKNKSGDKKSGDDDEDDDGYKGDDEDDDDGYKDEDEDDEDDMGEDGEDDNYQYNPDTFDDQKEKALAKEKEEGKNKSDRDKLIAAAFPLPPSDVHPFGTDNTGRDLACRLAYGFNVSLTFALILLIVAYTIGITIGSVLGYYGGYVDLFGQRVIEIWQTVPFLYTVMILGAALQLNNDPSKPAYFQPSFILLISILASFSWMGMTYFVRGEFLREKSKDYVSAAISIGTKDHIIIFKHILPNSLTPVVTFAPFAIVGNISSLVALDYLGFGLPVPTPSWGELMKQALGDLKSWWLVSAPIAALFVTLLLVVFIGEAVREAFDPKVFSRLR